ncbi:MAG: helix-turn-helix transcriptional regulator [Chloroflexi bacterium]|nr:helix-turn-helix transcriptional regulator [Chloroflexota bacterium]MBM3243171.1 helix-turn-helix transcriptional regulator [Candidatus Poribacteria bacterium]
MKRFGEKLHALRKQKNMTLKELATELGYVAHSHISQIESSKKKPTVELVMKVSDLFGVSTDCLLRDNLEIRFKE